MDIVDLALSIGVAWFALDVLDSIHTQLRRIADSLAEKTKKEARR